MPFFFRSIYVKKVMKLLAFIFEQPSYLHSSKKPSPRANCAKRTICAKRIGLDGVLYLLNSLCVRGAKVLAGLCKCTGSSEPSLIAIVTRTNIYCLITEYTANIYAYHHVHARIQRGAGWSGSPLENKKFYRFP